MSMRSLGSDLIPSETLTVMIAKVVKTIAMIGPTARLPKMIAVISAQIRPGVVTPMVTASRKKPVEEAVLHQRRPRRRPQEGEGEPDRDPGQRRGERSRHLTGRPQLSQMF